MSKKYFDMIDGNAVKKKGWFSWRHQTNAEHLEHQKKWRHKEQAKKLSADERQAYRDTLTPEQQLAVLDDRLGSGLGAQKERARLQLQIEKNNG